MTKTYQQKEIKIGIVDDESLFVEGLTLLIEGISTCSTVYKNIKSDEVVNDLSKMSPEKLPDILLLDIEMKPISGLQLVEELIPRFPLVKILILSSHYKANLIGHMIKIGVSGFLPKVIELKELEKALETVYTTGIYFSPSEYHLLRSYLSNPQKKHVSLQPASLLTKREIEIVVLICQEFTNQEIADQLFLSKRTIESHRQRILDKTGLKNTVGLVIYALANEIFVPDLKWIPSRQYKR
ncbi:response regulator transcription factor [Sphingobacterium sp. lm-10]|uniref:response regulator transcription factor n=1 Tax=Sphingobacterium sp. lm-10 TaxID=2944904 RepID=UPI002021099D|nr:response regulator transcription factor [Sphingobacterium sp. lm-10]MCL7986619.1 response regulator transcription factor [Sphingobacterium sp. lm-10]